MDHQNSLSIKREILTYLGKLPQLLKSGGTDKAADVALSLGNCLCWIAPMVDEKEPRVDQPVEETPTTIYALGKQFRAVALAFIDRPETHNGELIKNQSQIINDIESLRSIVARLEAKDSEKGGAK